MAAPTPEPERLTEAELVNLMNYTLKIVAENRLTKDNVWDSPYLEQLSNIISVENRMGATNFARMSSGVDAASQIWAKRVDATFAMVFQNLHGCKDGGQTLTDEGEEGAAAGPSGAAAKRKRATKDDADPQSTLTTADALRNKKISMTFDNDPLFKRTTQLFDENSANGLLVLNYAVGDRCHIAFDGAARVPLESRTNLPPPAVRTGAKVQLPTIAADILQHLALTQPKPMTPAMGELLQLAQASQPGPQVQLDNAEMLKACMPPAMVPVPAHAPRASDTSMGGPSQSTQGGPAPFQGPSHADDATQDGGNDGDDGPDPEAMDVDMMGDTEPQDTAGRDANEGAAPFLQGDLDLGPDDGFDEPEPQGGAAAWSDMSDGEGDGDKGSPRRTQRSVFDDLEMGPGQASVGNNVWRYKAAKQARGGARKPAAAKTQRKQHNALDLSGPRLGVDAIEPTTNNISLPASKRKPANTLLPRGAHYQEQRLYTLSVGQDLYPQKYWEMEIKRAPPAALRPSTAAANRHRARTDPEGDAAGHDARGAAEGPQAWDGDEAGAEGADPMFGEDAGEEHGAGDWADADGGGLDVLEPMAQATNQFANHMLDPLSVEALLSAPRKVAPQAFHTTSKQVDVKALKNVIKGHLISQQEAQARQGQAQITFVKVMQDLSSTDNVSVHLAFICLLHLANENGLALNTEGALDRLNIRMPHPV